MLSTQGISCDITIVTRDSLKQLIDLGLVVQKRSMSQGDEHCDDCYLEVTSLGRATFKGIVVIIILIQCIWEEFLWQDLSVHLFIWNNFWLIKEQSWDYLNLTLANEYVVDITIPIQVIKYDQCCSRQISQSDCSIHIKLNYY